MMKTMFKDDNRINGFTLLEVLVVLLIWSVLILLIVPINFTHLEKQQEKYFLETLAFDILYTQNLSTTTKDIVRLNIYEDHYIVRRGHGYAEKTLFVRDVPSGWVLKDRIFRPISFDDKGRIKTPGHFIIQTKYHEYTVVFPFGKGRYHIVEQ